MTLKHEHTILLVDDETSITKALHRLFRREGYSILTASSGREGLALLEKTENPVSLIISDQRMPEMTGAQFLEKAKEIFPDAIRFLLTGYSDMDAIIDAVNRGEIHRYLAKPWNDNDLVLQVRQSLEQSELVLENRRLLGLTSKQNKELSKLNRDLEKKVSERTREISQKNEELEKSFMDTIRLLSALVETLNPRLGRHMRHVAQLSKEVAEEYVDEKEDVDEIEIAGMIHDIGLLGLHEAMWIKDERDLNSKESTVFSQHPVIAQLSLGSVERLTRVGKIILHHHECYDGSGFPDGLKGDEIPLGSRIIRAVADYFRVLNTWPKDRSQIVYKTRKCLGVEVARNLVTEEPNEMIGKVAEKIILVGAHEKYDVDVVIKLTKRIGMRRAAEKAEKIKKKTSCIELKELKEGMILAGDFRVKDGRILLTKGSVLKKSSIKDIQNLWKKQLLDNKIWVCSVPGN